MSYRLLTSGAFVCALGLAGFAGQADATTRVMMSGAPSLTILAQDEENAAGQNLLEPETDGGQPGGGDDAMKPEAAPKGEEMKAAPEAGDEMKEMKEEK
jgi:hypothetical protein